MAGRLAGARALGYSSVPMALRAAQMPAHGAYGDMGVKPWMWPTPTQPRSARRTMRHRKLTVPIMSA